MEEKARITEQVTWVLAGHRAVQPQGNCFSSIGSHFCYQKTLDITCETSESRAFIIDRVMVYSHYF